MNEHGKINYVEFHSNNLEASKSFFRQVFGWTFQDFGPDYTSFSCDTAGLGGGFFSAEKIASTENGSALVVLYSSNLEETQLKVVEAGGTVVREIFSFPGGRRFHFREPSGNELAVWSDNRV